MEESIHALDTISGRIGDIPRDQFENPLFSWHLVEVAQGTKEVAVDLVNPMTADEWHAAHSDVTPSTISADVSAITNMEVAQ
jgi:hypothetical protein